MSYRTVWALVALEDRRTLQPAGVSVTKLVEVPKVLAREKAFSQASQYRTPFQTATIWILLC